MNLHYIDGKPVYEGDQVQIGGNEAYYPVCRKHYFHPGIKKKENKTCTISYKRLKTVMKN